MRSNFLQCLKKANGLYYWSHGSLNTDSIGKRGSIRKNQFVQDVLITRCIIGFIGSNFTPLNCISHNGYGGSIVEYIYLHNLAY